ncbi:tRNA preQ1(34) S-adenosylmethionine ribosyltransferase-isomerase QueA [Beijerinckia indica]|uniref:S-adenosylmethionine:tRNA ribosyltransferase-isomerase n=1 Tax=Beijerinckia indica subsp. indica (strain ATCC 9039 / DSM 1715 / NCIMB 8712) TaxID=395963 RepID=QUEA_BEII9|nr:tRNA preQ1(34) S-adenosylmethionine ribosyltransferase-isomerase QueA [Beijerinckia indica]B2IHG4.1 RecName: Full=S-adenosylmethionine:tRNA ribosyltransferase-isomerase; AltName: Full=Queuosine biosynthesis protein QueA [Beijerinckia indica subsp. indica ATCC 9039]ACB95949.1 S-adenosylmethionine--tRNA-ribosyltransferase-isomerase [Beijerinckia indica subsp. indica ATCC 9039]
MRVDLFDFDLPPERIALRPVEPRDASRLLVVRPDSGDMTDHGMRELPDFLRAGDVLVVNDTRVIPARLHGFRSRGESRAKIEATLHKREGEALWRAFVKPAKKLRVGETICFARQEPGTEVESLEAEVLEKGAEGEVVLGFNRAGAALDAALDLLGEMPLPPYIAGKRAPDSQDSLDYQTLFANRSGAVAAPTASLHFTPRLIAAIEARGVTICKVTLHVGAGTFLPVKAEDTDAHRMHAEWGEVSAEVAAFLNKVHAAGGRIIAAGTTSLRLLESAVDEDGLIQPFQGETSIFMTPGFRFRAVDILLTNFHLPRSTLFMLVCAFAGLETMRRAYAHAIAASYRFYSYGDACLLFRATRNTSTGAAL